ncbi:MAG: MGMT family protein [Thermoplasmatota archaeon]
MAAKEARTTKAKLTPFYVDVFRVVRRIPRGKVLSYGDVGLAAGYPRAARAVAAALKSLGRQNAGSDLPWQRVVGGNGEVRIQNPYGRREQIVRLAREGVDVNAETGKLDYAKFAWRPRGG